jgi:hypothetical protein
MAPYVYFAAPMMIGYLVWWDLATKWQAML